MSEKDKVVDAEVVGEENKKEKKENHSGDELDTFFKDVENLPLWAKVILALPGIDLFWQIYRLLKSVKANNILGIVLAVVILIVGIPFLWIIDIVFIAVYGHIWWLD